MSLSVIFQTLLEAGGDQGQRMWVWSGSHGPVILLNISFDRVPRKSSGGC